MRLQSGPNKTQKTNMNPNQVIKIEAPDDDEQAGDNREKSKKDNAESGSMESSDNTVDSGIASAGRSDSTSSQPPSPSNPAEPPRLSPVVKSEPPEPPELSAGNNTTSGAYSEIASQGGLSLGADLSSIAGISGDSVPAGSSALSSAQELGGSSIPQTIASATDPNIVKTEAADDNDEELEITRVEPGQMSVSNNTWMPNVQSRMGYDPSTLGAANMEGPPGQGYGEWHFFVFWLFD